MVFDADGLLQTVFFAVYDADIVIKAAFVNRVGIMRQIAEANLFLLERMSVANYDTEGVSAEIIQMEAALLREDRRESFSVTIGIDNAKR